MLVSRAPASYRIFSGLGQTPFVPYVCPDGSTALTADQCPSTPSMLPAPLSPQQIAALSAYNAAYFGGTSPYAPLVPATPAGITAILNQNPNLVYWGLGLLVLLAFLSEGRR